MPGSDQFDTWRVDGIVRRTAEQEEEEASLIWCVEGAGDEGVNLWRHEKEDALLQTTAGRITRDIHSLQQFP